MNKYRFFHDIKIAFFAIIGVGLLGYVVMHLWNWLMPSIFGLGTLTFTKALGLFLLAKLLFGGFRGRGGCYSGKSRWKYNMYQKYKSMTPEERKTFKERFSHGRGCWGTHEKIDDKSQSQSGENVQ